MYLPQEIYINENRPKCKHWTIFMPQALVLVAKNLISIRIVYRKRLMRLPWSKLHKSWLTFSYIRTILQNRKRKIPTPKLCARSARWRWILKFKNCLITSLLECRICHRAIIFEIMEDFQWIMLWEQTPLRSRRSGQANRDLVWSRKQKGTTIIIKK